MSEGGAFQFERLSLARRRRGISKTTLAARVGVSLRMVTAYESGEKEPSRDTLDKLGAELGFPTTFFELPVPPSLSPGIASFRALSKMSAGQRDCVLAAGALAIELDQFIEREFERPLPELPDLRGFEPEAAGMSLRTAWGLGIRPVGNLVHLLEAKGVRIYSLAHESRDVDAFSFWWDERPFVFLNTVKSAERSRFDAAHELGHLVLHRHGGPEGRVAEQEADRFAAGFLLPKADVLGNAPRRATLPSVIAAKHRWGVSALALVHRLHALRLLPEWHYRQLCIKLRMQYGSGEPEERQRETSQVLAKVFDALRRSGVSRRQVAATLRVSTRDLDELVFGLTFTTVKGEGSSSGSATGGSAKLSLG